MEPLDLLAAQAAYLAFPAANLPCAFAPGNCCQLLALQVGALHQLHAAVGILRFGVHIPDGIYRLPVAAITSFVAVFKIFAGPESDQITGARRVSHQGWRGHYRLHVALAGSGHKQGPTTVADSEILPVILAAIAAGAAPVYRRL